MNRELNFSGTKNDFGHVLICWWVTLFLRVSYWSQVVKINFNSINFNKLMKIVSFLPSWCMTYIMNMTYIIAYGLPYWDILSRVVSKFQKLVIIISKFEKFNIKSLRRSSITPLQKQSPDVFHKKAVPKTFTIFTGKHLCFPVNIAKCLMAPILKIICKWLLLSLEVFCKDFVDIR